ncbi:MAG: universal stress protein [Syntrophorhabdaceae bacterium]
MNSHTMANNIDWKTFWPEAAALSSFPRTNKNGIRTILVPTDFSEYSDTALQLAIDLARPQNAKINLLHVLRFRDPNSELHMLQRQIAKFPGAGDIEIIPSLRKGKIFKEILNAEAETNADLIIMSRHREGNSLLSLFRSITLKIRKNAHCSVLVVGA